MNTKRMVTTTVLVSALGYFVDIYDLILFSIVRVPSLRSMGVSDDQLLDVGVFLLNAQMIGMLVGGILWGVLGDKKGRLSVLFGSIFLYSIANIANAFVTTVEGYGLMRFLAGVGLAGELGAAITLVSEVMSKEQRGYGTAIVASVGICGAVAAALIGDAFTWQTAYIVGGVLGLILLVMRITMFESGMYHTMKQKDVRKGDLRLLLGDRQRLIRYLSCILCGVPIWYVIGILVTFSPELSRAIHVNGEVIAGNSVMFSYIGLAVGDLASGFISQYLKSRKKILYTFIGLTLLFILVYLYSDGLTPVQFYWVIGLLGFAVGYWAVFVTVASEHFGTNLRATVTTTAPNFVRGSVVPLTLAFRGLESSLGLVGSALAVGVVSIVIAILAVTQMDETYGKNLDYIES